MIGVFDSGAGGVAALGYLRDAMPRADLAFLADRENAPYGKKSEEELVRLVTNDIKRLRCVGAQDILMACCTACTVYDKLSPTDREIAHPIIAPTAEAAVRATKTGRIGVLATERTVNCSAFRLAILSLIPNATVIERAAPELVFAVEHGLVRNEVRKAVFDAIAGILHGECDTLILGCTHFSHLTDIIGEIAPTLTLIDSAKEGAISLSNKLKDKGEGGARLILLT